MTPDELLEAASAALLFSLPVLVVGGIVLRMLRRRSLTAAIVALVLVPLLATLSGVVGVSGFMFTPQLGDVLLACLVVTVIVVPAGTLFGRTLAREALWQHEARDAERRSERSRRELVAGMSHDLRSPLAGIGALADSVLDGIVHRPDEVQDYVRRIQSETRRMTDMVEDLFQLSRATSGTLQLKLRQIPLAEIASDAVAAEAVVARATGVDVQAIAPEDWPLVHASDADLARVVRNVVANAVRHTPAGGSVVLTAGGREGGLAWLRVDDECGGIPPQDLGRIFDVGYRGTGARTPGAHGGAGLGLAIARGLMGAQNGGISVVNNGPGCRAELTLPTAPSPRNA
ncbi:MULTISPECIES: HAMP domain-containing sensor histidine kinase [unclassified Pseudonocardia]|uniref:sensor histidine kinase n=1 Tax=unclassified Pseudonocardia TaxID=2619320 RepID=UPI0001FFDC30|nr:HAMP domain-containing sensor histidine kinase [Pseudonocardia sp. Ae707_Ps1]OLM18616.1 putative two-component system sensor kinase [Pseudonocardia sp. Ae707_Ps1]